MNKHTPGPWGVRRHNANFEIFSDDELIAWVQPTLLPEDDSNLRGIGEAFR